MWKPHDRKEVQRIINRAKAQGSPFSGGSFRLDCAEYIALMALALTAFPRMWAYVQELEAALKAAGIETPTMQAVRRRPNF